MGTARIIKPVSYNSEDQRIPATLRCACGNYITLTDDLDNPCNNCPRNYNMSGQEVLYSRDPRVEEPCWDGY